MSSPNHQSLEQPLEQPLERQLHQLHLAAILDIYQPTAQEAADQQWSYTHYLAHLVNEETARRTGNRLQRRIQEAHFPLFKELADFDFAAIPSLKRQLVLELAEGHYLPQAESVLLVGNPGLGKSHIAIALGLAACRQGKRVRFYNVTHLSNELQEAQASHEPLKSILGCCEKLSGTPIQNHKSIQLPDANQPRR